MATLLSVLILLSSPHIYHYQNQNLIFEEWSITKNIRANGRITTFFHSSNKRKKTLTRLVSEPSMDLSQYLFTKRPLNTPDIHIIVLESFIHPQFIKKIRFNFSPLHPMLRPYLNGEKDFSLVQSPVFGGGTAQSEFELLTGIPALSLIESIEFNYFEGSKTPSFVNRLEQFGYFTMGAIGTKPKFYNSQIAYKGLGFREITYVNQGYFTNNSEDEYIFDGDLFNANLEHLERVTSHHGPIFNYIVGMYGHLPYERNLNKRPDVISTNGKNDSLNRITNQFYYRTKALATFIEALQQRDREAIILVVSD
ncbi:MAG: sulfatase-like hydrolase/transferase, partial [Desulfobacteraceae bacterium]|nr:sulfatase-like hydrolase/transferase [Desulfobacteraceae bacterium]